MDYFALLEEAEQFREAQVYAVVALYEARMRKSDAKIVLELAKNAIALSLADVEAERQQGRNQTIRDARTDQETAGLAATLRAAEHTVMAAEVKERLASCRSQLVAYKVALAPLFAVGQTVA